MGAKLLIEVTTTKTTIDVAMKGAIDANRYDTISILASIATGLGLDAKDVLMAATMLKLAKVENGEKEDE